MNLLIQHGIVDGQSFTPAQFEDKKELRNRVKKKEGGVSLRCPDGCRLCFRMKSAYTNTRGTDIKRRSHFAHISAERANACLFIQKYGSKGESPAHANTREMIAEMDVVFERMCSHPCCRSVFTWHPKKSHLLTSRMEVPFKVGGIRKFFADVVYYNANGDIEAVIEVKHTHAVDKDKRTWLVNQPFKFIEVSTNDNPSKRQFTVIDSDKVFYCDGDVCNKGVSILKKQEEEDHRRRQEEEDRWRRQEEDRLRRQKQEEEDRLRRQKQEEEDRLIRQKQREEDREKDRLRRQKQEEEDRLQAEEDRLIRQKQREEDREKDRLRRQKQEEEDRLQEEEDRLQEEEDRLKRQKQREEDRLKRPQKREDRLRRLQQQEKDRVAERSGKRRALAEWIVNDGKRGGGVTINADELTNHYHSDRWQHDFYFPDLKFTNEIIDSLCAEFKFLNDDRRLRLLIREDKWEEIQEREDWRHVYTNEQNRRLKEWKNSSLNKWLIKMQPNLVCPTGKPKGIHILLVAFVYPHQINYITGFENSGTSDDYRMKYIDIVKACLDEDMTGGRPFRQVSRPRVRSVRDAIDMLSPYDPDIDNHPEVVGALQKFIKTQLC